MKIAIDARMLGAENTTGIGQYIEQLTNHLFQIDSENEYLIFLLPQQYQKFQPPNNRVKKALVSAHWYTYAEQWRLPLEFKKHQFDLIHFPHFNSPLLWTGPSICTIHDMTPFYFSGHKMKSKIRRLAHRLVFSHTINHAQKIIAVSHYTKQQIISHFPLTKNKVQTVYNGVDSRFKNINDHDIIDSVKKRYGITHPFLFYVGVWRNHKNLEGLIKAFEIIQKKHQGHLQLVLAGQEDSHYQNIRQTIEKSSAKNKIITPGFIAPDDLPVLYSVAEMFILPSFIEGFGLVTIEAQKCHCPVLASQATSLPEILSNSAQYFDPYQPQTIAKAIIGILNNPELKKNLIAKGIVNAEKYSWHHCAQQTLYLYQQILNQNEKDREKK